MGLFSWVTAKPRASAASLVDDDQLQTGVEQVVEQIDPRLRMIGGYQKKLRPIVEVALRHTADLAARVPAAREASARTWSTDPTIHALFSSVAELRTFFGRNRELRTLFSSPAGAHLQECVAVLAMSRREQTRFGTRFEGDTIQRDVMQTSVDFFDRVLFAPAVAEDEVRRRLQERIFERLVLYTLADMASKRSRKETLERERAVLTSRLKILQGKAAKLDSLFEPAVTSAEDLEAVAEELARNERELAEVPRDVRTLEHSLKHIGAVLGHPERHLSLDTITLRLDRMNIKVDDDAPETGEPVTLAEAAMVGYPARVGLLVSFPREELPPEEDLLEKARRYLG